MKSILFALFASAAFSLTGVAAAKDTRCFEMRTYYTPAGKLAELNARFRDHTLKLFEKHGISNIGYWTPIDPKDGSENTLVYLLAYPSREARESSWKAFMADPDWKTAYKASEANGKLVEKVESRFLQATDYSPAIRPSQGKEPRVFELRTYTTTPGNLEALHARFRDHTIALFSKHGMTNFGYLTPMPGEKGADNTLVYILAHKSKEAAAASFKGFRDDPAWVAARKASEEKAGGSLTVTNGVKSVFMSPTDYSPTK
jgi:hypothetical protein